MGRMGGVEMKIMRPPMRAELRCYHEATNGAELRCYHEAINGAELRCYQEATNGAELGYPGMSDHLYWT